MTQLARAEETAVAPVQGETAALISMIERVALNPSVDIEKMERLLEMQERIMARNARIAYNSALSAMQAEMPEIPENGTIRIKAKDSGNIIQETPYALWEDINEAIRPVLARHGFALSFRTGLTPDARVSVTAILSHREGHQEETTMVLAHDSTGSKNAVQAIGSSTSYGKRYATAALLNLTSRDGLETDDDGQTAVEIIPKSKAREIDKEMRAEIDKCATKMELKRLWASKEFQKEFERHPKDWQQALIRHFDDRLKDIDAQDPPKRPVGYVDPKDQFDRMEREGVRS